MIYTVTFNPSLDYVIGAEKLEPGKINRTTRENIYPGGKGNNVSVVLSNLGHKSKALGFVSGFTGEALEKMLDDFGCYTDFIQLDNGFTRINVKINAEFFFKHSRHGHIMEIKVIGIANHTVNRVDCSRCSYTHSLNIRKLKSGVFNRPLCGCSHIRHYFLCGAGAICFNLRGCDYLIIIVHNSRNNIRPPRSIPNLYIFVYTPVLI